MSYPQFNLTTLQLPAPASNMTKAEYKAAYGIDLDQVDIKTFKLVLLGKDKFPITQIKEVEDGIEIYFNGRILSITDIVQTSDELYDVANAKPIYCHPCTILTEISSGIYEGRRYFLTCLIFNNSETPFTVDTWKSYVENLCTTESDYKASIMVSGGLYNPDGSVVTIANCIKYESGSSQVAISGMNVSTGNIDRYGLSTMLSAETTFTDGVNKIN